MSSVSWRGNRRTGGEGHLSVPVLVSVAGDGEETNCMSTDTSDGLIARTPERPLKPISLVVRPFLLSGSAQRKTSSSLRLCSLRLGPMLNEGMCCAC